MYIAGAILLSAFVGGLCGAVFGPYGLVISVPLGIWFGYRGATLQIESRNS